MEFKLSDHAQKRIQQRRIKPEWIKAAIDNPDQLEDDFEDPTLAHALKGTSKNPHFMYGRFMNRPYCVAEKISCLHIIHMQRCEVG